VDPVQGRLALLRLVSPALPVGAYAGSEGLEYAVEAGWLPGESEVQEWIGGRLAHSLCRLDIPLLARFYAAWQTDDAAALARWSGFLAAARETAELAAHDRSLGRSLARLLADLGVVRARALGEGRDVSYAAAFALAVAEWSIPLEAAAEGYLFAWLESQLAAAIKLVPLGQTQGQRILGALMNEIPALAARGLALADESIGFSEPGLAIASALHESQYARLFRC
jgi:urease accessory protein